MTILWSRAVLYGNGLQVTTGYSDGRVIVTIEPRPWETR